jgi:FixJ family two-component response regulator
MKKNDLIFIVEDDHFYASALECFLNSLGFTNIEHYSTGIDCVNNSYKMPKLVLLDYNLSDVKGVNVMLELISFDSNTPIVFISAQESVQDAIDTLKYGSYDYIQKDEKTYQKLRHVIDKITKLKEELRKRRQMSRLKTVGFSALAISMLSITLFSTYFS